MVNNITLEDIIQYYEIDIDNCLMTRLDLIEWIEVIKSITKDSESFKLLSRNTLKTCWSTHSFNVERTNQITEIFI
jgi:hypothetical protein